MEESNKSDKNKKTISILTELDLLGDAMISFTVDKRDFYRSPKGGALTILFFLFALLYFALNIVPFLRFKKVQMIYSQKVISTSPLIDYRNTSFTFAYALQYSNFYLEKETPALNDAQKYFDFTAKLRIWEGESDIRDIILNNEFCNEEDIPSDLEDEFYLNALDEMYCPKSSVDKNFTLEGTYTDDYYKFFILEVSFTKYALDHLDEVKKLMEEKPMELILFFEDKAINYENITAPIPSFFNSIVEKVDFDFVKSGQLYINNLEFKRDDNLIIDKTKIEYEPMFDNYFSTFKYYTNRTNNLIKKRIRNLEENQNTNEEENEKLGVDEDKYSLAKINISPSRKVIQINRKYQKLADFLSELASFLGGVLTLLGTVTTFLERREFKRKFIEKYWDFIKQTEDNVKRLAVEYKKDPNEEFQQNKMAQALKDAPLSDVAKDSKNNASLNKLIDSKNKKDENFDPNSSNSSSRNNSNRSIEKVSDINVIIDNTPEKNTNKDDNLTNENNNQKLQKRKSQIFRRQAGRKSIRKATKAIEVYKFNNKIEGCCDKVLNFLWCRKSVEKEFLKKAETRLFQYLDIYSYVHRIQEIDMLNYVLLDQNQKTIFNFIDNPALKMAIVEDELYERYTKKQTFFIDKFGVSEVFDLCNAYNAISKKEELNEVDKRMLELFETQLDIYK